MLEKHIQGFAGRTIVQGENVGGNGYERSLQMKQHFTGFIGCAGDGVFGTEPGV